jgi:DNA-formamidopyrimidine glycosylase/dephospho-CoA kinase
MPELPEVESVVRTLRPLMVGATIAHTTLLVPNMVKPNPSALVRLHGKTCLKIERIGKFIIFFFQENLVMVSHLRMEGKYFLLPDAKTPMTRFARLVFTFKDGRRMVYDDMRKFGTFELATNATYRQLPSLVSLGIEPMQVEDHLPIHQAFHRSRRPIKTLLLDQTILLGLGNIYADEVLYASQLNPLKIGKDLSLSDTKNIIFHSAKILTNAIAAGGTRIRSYASGASIDGRFTLSLHAYDQQGKPCHRCGKRIVKIFVAQRGTHYCPRCQHHPDYPFVIGVTGTIATGKSSLLEVAKTLDISTLKADDLVHALYQQAAVKKKLQTYFPESVVKGTIDRQRLLMVMVKDHQAYTRWLKWLFPLVKKAIEHKLIKMKTKAVIIEVPLLFQSDLDGVCDVIIGVETPQIIQRKRLSLRQPLTAEALWILNERNRYQDYLPFIDYRLINDQSLTSWQKKVRTTLDNILRAIT